MGEGGRLSYSSAMNYRKLGKAGTKVSALGLGGWTTFGGSVVEESRIREILTAAFESGVNFFDIADVYSKGESERMMGSILKSFPRHELVISSKLFFPISQDPNDRGLSRKHIMESIDKSLRQIGTDYLDIYFCHRFDNETPLEETIRAMDDLVHRGKILYWGTSMWSAAQLDEAHRLARENGWYPPQVEQPEYNLLEREHFESESLPAAQRNGMGLVTWSPLASGLLSGKYDDGLPPASRLAQIEWLREGLLSEARVEQVKKFKKFAGELGCSRSQLALAWLLSRPGISSVITGATRAEQVRENLGALKVKIPEALLGGIEALFAG